MERLIRSSQATGLRWVMVCLAGVGVGVVGCGDDHDSAAVTPGNAGQAGAAEGGKSGSGGSPASGTASTAGGVPMTMSGAAGAEIAGEGGVAGMPQAPSVGEVCKACGDLQCKSTLKACSNNAECAPWLSCVAACDTAACITACDDAHEDVARVYRGVYDCLCTSCSAECAPADACNKKTCVEKNGLGPSEVEPETLAETGLYALAHDLAGGAGGDANGGAGGAGGAGSTELAMPLAIARHAHLFTPKYPLWSDGAVKSRYIYIPKCATIDDSDMDHWDFPVGTRVWKTFAFANKVVETRMLHRFGAGPNQWVYAAYQWDVNNPGDPTRAKCTNDVAVANANGSGHDIPGKAQCQQCHNTGLSEKVLGFGAFQLSHDSSGADLTIKKISDLGWLDIPAPDGFQVPGSAVQQAALGYLHGNCGGCHNDLAQIPYESPQILRLSVAQKVYAETDLVKTTVGVVVQNEGNHPELAGKSRIAPSDPNNSAIIIRMSDRTQDSQDPKYGLQMPPVFTDATKLPDTNVGIKDVTAWINSL